MPIVSKTPKEAANHFGWFAAFVAMDNPSRVVVDGYLVTAAGVTAGLDAALVVASLLRGDAIPQEIQLSIQYAHNPVFHSGTPDRVPAEVLQAATQQSQPPEKPKRGGSRPLWVPLSSDESRLERIERAAPGSRPTRTIPYGIY